MLSEFGTEKMGLLFADRFNDGVALLVIVATLVAYYLRRVYTYWQRNGVQSLPRYFPFGNFGPIFMQTASFGLHMQTMYRATTERYIGIYAGFRPTLLLCDPELVRTVMVKDFQHFQDRGIYIDEVNDPLSGHLLALNGEKWKVVRGKLTPTFTSGKLKAMFSTLTDNGKSLIEFLDKRADDYETVEMREIFAQYTTNVIASVAFGLDIDCIKDPEIPFRKFGRKVYYILGFLM